MLKTVIFIVAVAVTSTFADDPCAKNTGEHKAFDRDRVKNADGPQIAGDCKPRDGFGRCNKEHITAVDYLGRSGSGAGDNDRGIGSLTFEYGTDSAHSVLCDDLVYTGDSDLALIKSKQPKDDHGVHYKRVAFAECERLVSMLVLWGGQRDERIDAIVLTTKNLDTGLCKTYRLNDSHGWLADKNGDGVIDEADIDLASKQQGGEQGKNGISKYTRLGDKDGEITGWRIRHGFKDTPRCVDFIEVEARKLPTGGCPEQRQAEEKTTGAENQLKR